MDTEEAKQSIAYPEKDEVVIATVRKVQNYGAFVSLEEYPGCEGMIHISEISSKWVKNIRDYTKEGQKIVAKVLRVDAEKGHIDLSLKSVKGIQRKEKLDQYKKEQRALKLISIAAESLKEKEKEAEIVSALNKKFDSLYNTLENCLSLGEDAFKGAKIPENWKSALTMLAKENIEIPQVKIKATLELSSEAENGIEIIKNSILSAEKANRTKDVEISMKYLGAPKYQIVLTAPNYKVAEQVLGKMANEVIKEVTKIRGSAKLVR